MIRRIQALNYRCLRHVDVHLDGPFHVLVGPNASGKSTLFDVVAFLADFVSEGLEAAVEKRTRNFQDLVWGRPRANLGFELALEFDIAPALSERLPPWRRGSFRYEVAVREDIRGVYVLEERGTLGNHSTDVDAATTNSTIFRTATGSNNHPVFQREPGGLTLYRPESEPDVSEELPLGMRVDRQSALRFLPSMPSDFKVSNTVGPLLQHGVQTLLLDSRQLRLPSPPGRGRRLLPNGANLPWVVQRLRETDKGSFDAWVSHLRTTLRDLCDIRVIEREDDRHAYLMIVYENGVEAPSWVVSDGTLRLLALTLIAYLPGGDSTSILKQPENGIQADPRWQRVQSNGDIYLLEEPENGIHPMAIETVYQSLSSVYDSQVLVASHSPVLLRCTEPKEVLCFARDAEGATNIVPGDQHPRLPSWRSSTDSDLFFASEILG